MVVRNVPLCRPLEPVVVRTVGTLEKEVGVTPDVELQLVKGNGGRVWDTPLALVVGQLRVDGLNVV